MQPLPSSCIASYLMLSSSCMHIHSSRDGRYSDFVHSASWLCVSGRCGRLSLCRCAYFHPPMQPDADRFIERDSQTTASRRLALLHSHCCGQRDTNTYYPRMAESPGSVHWSGATKICCERAHRGGYGFGALVPWAIRLCKPY